MSKPKEPAEYLILDDHSLERLNQQINKEAVMGFKVHTFFQASPTQESYNGYFIALLVKEDCDCHD